MNSTTQTFFGLTNAAFTQPPTIPYLDPPREKAMAQLRALVARRGFALLTAPPGCGKTAMLHYLAGEFSDNHHQLIYIPHTFLEKANMLSFICCKMGLEPRRGMAPTLRVVQRHLADIQPVNPVIVIDEVERVDVATATIIRLIANDRADTVHHTTLILAGAESFIEHTLRLHVNEPLRQRITLYVQLRPLTAEHTDAYVAHHLQHAGAATNPFNAPALQLIHELAGGVPRIINTLAEAAMDLAAERHETAVTLEHVQSAAETALPPQLQQALP